MEQSQLAIEEIRRVLDDVYRKDSRRILATLIRLLGDFEIAEEAMHDAFATAMEEWNNDGIPSNPRGWLVSTGRFKAIDALRRQAKIVPSDSTILEEIGAQDPPSVDQIDLGVEDDQLRLIFTCCHPALAMEARIALTLREVCGLTTEEIASAFLTSPSTLAQRIVRAKSKIRDAKIPFEVPGTSELAGRLETVLQVVYLVFNEGYSASSGDSVTRVDLSSEAIRLCRLLSELLPEPEVTGLLALMLLHESRRTARASRDGDLVLLEDQDRSLWNREMISEGTSLLNQALTSQRIGPYTLQGAIAAVHSGAKSSAETDWSEIIALYDALLRVHPTPVIELNRAVAVAMRYGPAAGLDLIDAIHSRGDLSDYQFLHSARAELCRRLGRTDEARYSYEKALSLAQQEPEKRFLRRRIAELKG